MNVRTQTTKGAPHVILKLVNKGNRENKASLTEKVERDVHRFEEHHNYHHYC